MKTFKEYTEAAYLGPNDEMVKINIERPLLRALKPVEWLRELDPNMKMVALEAFKKFLGI